MRTLQTNSIFELLRGPCPFRIRRMERRPPLSFFAALTVKQTSPAANGQSRRHDDTKRIRLSFRIPLSCARLRRQSKSLIGDESARSGWLTERLT